MEIFTMKVFYNFSMSNIYILWMYIYGYIYIENFHSGIQWFMMEDKDFISNINFKLKNEHNKLVSFNGTIYYF